MDYLPAELEIVKLSNTNVLATSTCEVVFPIIEGEDCAPSRSIDFTLKKGEVRHEAEGYLCDPGNGR